MPEVKSDSTNLSAAGADKALGQSALAPSTPVLKKQKKKLKLKEKLRIMEQLDVLVHRRGMAKGKVTKILNIIRPVEGEEPRLTEAHVKVYLSKLESAHKEYHDVHEKILSLVSADDREDHDDHYEAFDELHDEASITLEIRMSQLRTTAVAVGQQHAVAIPIAPTIIHQPFRMPIPTFDGRYESWPKFKAMFKDLVDKSPDPPAVKLYHLDKSLVGSAAGLIDVKTINEGNYAHAWRLLEERYENKRHTIDTHIHGLLNLKRMTKESHFELRNLVDECTRHVESLKFLEQEFTGVSEPIVVHLLSAALDKETRRRWESTIKHGDLPSYQDTLKYLKEQCFILERCETTNQKMVQGYVKPVTAASKPSFQKTHAAVMSNESDVKCDFCERSHQNFMCSEFKSLSVQQRFAKVRERKVCFNCLRRGHRSSDCSSERTCQKCNRRHHSLLHADERPKPDGSKPETPQAPKGSAQEASQPAPSQITTATCSSLERPRQQVLLLTAVVDVIDKNNKTQPCRILLDSGSQANLITQSMAIKLGLKLFPSNVVVAGVNGTKTRSLSSSVVQLRSRYSSFQANVKCLVTDVVTADLPTSSFDISSWVIPPGVQLADPSFYRSGTVDMLLGNQLFMKLLLPGELSLADDNPVLRETQFGWVVGGVCEEGALLDCIVHSHTVTLEELSKSIQRFWEVEEIGDAVQSSSEADQCEQHFLTTHLRDASGRYVVQLPLKESISDLGDSRTLALRRFYALEKRFAQQPELKRQYVEFMEEYKALGHCKEINEFEDLPGTIKWYLPHHAVLRPSNTTTKCRVVFDASAKVSGCSLNDVMMLGAIKQSDLESIVLRFREPRYVLATDIAKMYRQINVDECHTPLQRVFWRKDPSSPVGVLELTTVTYGTASAPFLATRALQQLAVDEKKRFPVAANVVENSFYVDNALFGFNYLSAASEAQSQLIHLLKTGGFHLHKWASNSKELLEVVPEEDREELVSIERFGANEVIKTLGLMWNPEADELQYVSLPTSVVEKPTKRKVLSLIARMFDPLGLVAPVILIGKLLMQRIWKEGLEWDEDITADLLSGCEYFLKAIRSVNQLRIPRQVVLTGSPVFELHGFADASQEAYGACVYIRSVVPGQPAVVRLLSAKSKIVPKSVLTIPRKELLAALLLHRLVKKVISALMMAIEVIVLWSDSQVVLAWLMKNPSLLDVFVRNRVCEITSTGKQFRWRYVRTTENPADIVSRGQPADRLAGNDLWWNGPLFLRSEEYQMIVPEPLCEDVPELISTTVVHTVVKFEQLPVFEKFESFRRLQRVIAYVLRFCRNAKERVKDNRTTHQYPTIPELRESMRVIVRVVQTQGLADEIPKIISGKPCKRISSLSPFIENGLVRVGGRLRNAKLPYEFKHQWILPNRNPLVERLITALHREHLHAGPSSLLAHLRRQFWVIGGRSAVRKITRSCVQCFRVKPQTVDQFMGDLPASRCDRAPAFQKVGVDFAGPIFIKQAGRKAPPIKGYICVFVCMVTKGIHLEVVENMSTEAFIAALHRFVSRRGLPEDMYSDNGTNFVGARNELRELYEMFKQEATQKQIFEFCQPRQIQWKMIPPNAPHMGGIWEAGVKSAKAVMKKVCKSAMLTMMEFATLLCQIEAQLNSRPLYAHSEDPAEPEPLTPGHFLIDRPLTAIPEPTYDEIPVNRLSRWQYVQQLRGHFWKRWSREYLMELQTRTKWTQGKVNLRPGMVVMIKDDNLPPQCWRMGRIEATYPGPDSMVRVVDLRTKAGGILKRPIHKLAPLPILDNFQSSSELEIVKCGVSPGEDVRAD